MHRDIKPENILFETEGNDGCIRLIDFGSARNFNSEYNMKQRCGSI